MPLKTRRKPAEPDWAAVRAALAKPRQRHAWNYLRGQLYEEVLEIGYELSTSGPWKGDLPAEYAGLDRAKRRITALLDLINTIPYLH